MRSLLRLRGTLVRGLRRPLAAVLGSAPARRLLRAGLRVLGAPTVLALHDETLSWLTSRPLEGRRVLLARRLRRGAGMLRYRPGILSAGDPGADVPVTLVVAWGVSAAALGRLVDDVEQDAGRQPRFAPIFVTDCDDFDAFRRHGRLFEYIPCREEWTRYNGADGWPAYVARRIDGILEDWDPDRMLVVHDDEGAALRRDGLWSALIGPRAHRGGASR